MPAKILIVDDDTDFVDSVEIVLGMDYEIYKRNSTDGLLPFIHEIRPDLIFLDVMFPEDPDAGFKACARIAEDPEINTIPVVILSAVNARSDLSFSHRADECAQGREIIRESVEKPIEPGILISLVNKYVK